MLTPTETERSPQPHPPGARYRTGVVPVD
jgi:hypothetical protein